MDETQQEEPACSTAKSVASSLLGVSEVAFRMENEGPAKCRIEAKKNNTSMGRGGQPWWFEKLVTETVMRQEKEAYMLHAVERTSGAVA